jgi:hypothetical protein
MGSLRDWIANVDFFRFFLGKSLPFFDKRRVELATVDDFRKVRKT